MRRIYTATALALATCAAGLPHTFAGEGKAKRIEERKEDGEKINRKRLLAALDAEIAEFDADKDGKLDHGEKRKALASLREKIAKKDGDIDRGELKKLREKHPELHERLMSRMEREEKREATVDHREAHQEHRIDQGIKKGYLTPSETEKLQGLEKNIADTEAAFKSDGKLSKDESKKLRDLLDEASVQIWAEKHDTEGNQMPTFRYGKNVFAKNDFTAKLESENMTGEQAREVMKEFRHASSLKRKLGNESLVGSERDTLQAEYNNFLNVYFEVR